jgi:hypothetical protein
MAGERNFLGVPPDSAGKKIRLKHTAQIFYSQLQGSHTWQIGAIYTTTFTDNASYTVHVHGSKALTNTTGILEVHYNSTPVTKNLNPIPGADILGPDGEVVASVESFRDVYINSNHIIGYDNPEYGVDVDPTGSMNVRFSEGLPQLDAFGKLRTSGATILGDYVFSENSLPQYFTSTIWGRGKGTEITHDSNRHALVLTTPSTVAYGHAIADPDSGIMSETTAYSATHTTDTYHHYFPGFSHMAIMTVALASTGISGVAQKWGYFDDANGYYFQVVDNRGLEFVIRSSATGDLTETVIGRTSIRKYINNVLQSNEFFTWNGDLVDGTGDSGKNLVLTDDNIYWLDIQWLGAGRVRFGTYHKGQRVVIHEYYHDNNEGFPHSQSGSLPLRYQQYNIANKTVSESTSMRVWCASVVTEAEVELNNQGFGQLKSFEVTFDPSNLNDYKGLNDTGKNDRLGVTKTGCTASAGSTTLNVPDVVGIKPGAGIHSMSGGTGTVNNEDRGTTVLEIVNSTTVILSRPVLTDFDGTEVVRFHLNVDHEYHLIGILAPVTFIGPQTTYKNRTIYQPKSLQAWAYHENGDDAFCEVEVYTQPIISGNAKSMTTPQSENGVLQLVERNNPYAGTESYEFSDGLVNYFGSGFHNAITFCKGKTETIDLSSAYGNYQAGAFKLSADDGGNNRCPVARVYQSSAPGVATAIQINTPPTGIEFTNHRENETAVTFEGIPGAIGNDPTHGMNYSVSGKTFYVRHLDIEKLELYEDKAFTVPYDTSFATTGIDPSTNLGGSVNFGPAGIQSIAGGLTWPGNTGTISTGGFIISGYGDQLYFAIVAKPVGPSKAGTAYQTNAGNITVHFKLTWNEILQ